MRTGIVTLNCKANIPPPRDEGGKYTRLSSIINIVKGNSTIETITLPVPACEKISGHFYPDVSMLLHALIR